MVALSRKVSGSSTNSSGASPTVLGGRDEFNLRELDLVLYQ